MGFLQPLALLGLTAAAIPAMLHLLQRRIPPTVPFPAVRYLSETERRHSRRLKLRNLLLLLLRTLLIVLVVLAAARPVARLPIGDVHGPSALAVVIDNSLSSGAVSGGQRVLDGLADAARRAIRQVGSADRLWIVAADGIPRRMSRTEALLYLDSLTPQAVRLDVTAAARTAARVVADDPLPGEVLVVSDLQRTALPPGDAPVARTVIVVSPALPANRGVDAVELVPRVWSPGGRVMVSVGGSGAARGEVRLVIDEQVVARDLAAPGDEAALAVRELGAGWHVARVEVGSDELRADDTRYVALRSARPTAATAAPGAGAFVAQAVDVLHEAGRVTRGTTVVLDDAVRAGRTILFPPAEAALVGAVNRALASRGVRWRFDPSIRGEWRVAAPEIAVADGRVVQRHPLRGDGAVLARVGGAPWVVRDGDVVLVGSRMEEEWTSLPVSADFVPFLDELINRVAGTEVWRVAATPGGEAPLPPTARAMLGSAGRIPLSGGRVHAPAESGVYFLLGELGDTIGALEVNHDPAESVLEAATARDVAATFGGEAEVVRPDELEHALFRNARRADLTVPLLALALALALVELTLATVGGRAREDS